MDQVLEAWLATEQAGGEDERLGELLDAHVMPVVTRVVTRRIGRSSDADDVASEVMLQLMLRLRDGRSRGDLEAIDSLAGYVATAAHHGCDHFLRRKYPLRWQLRNRVRYVLEHDARFAIWKSPEGAWLCGLAAWRGRQAGVAPPAECLSSVRVQSPRDLLQHIFDLTAAPLELPTLVDLAALVWHVPQSPEESGDALDILADGRPGIDATLQQRSRVKQVWTEIRALPVRQRQALLLNLKDGAIALFIVTGCASLRAIAECVEMNVEELAGRWNDLPMSDNAIATLLGATRQQVINFRMAARKRLVNRLCG